MAKFYDASWVWDYFASPAFAEEYICARLERLELIHRIATKTWDDYLHKPQKCDDALWDSVVRRFSVIDLQTPVLTTISSASHSGTITRLIKRAYNKTELEQAMKESNYDAFIRERIVPESHQYGTSFVVPGWRRDKFNFTQLPVLNTKIDTPEDDVDDILGIITHYSNKKVAYGPNSITDIPRGGQAAARANSNYGFIPVSIFRGRDTDPGSPYGEDLVYPATQETKQCSYLGNDIMVLERLQSFSTLVVKGTEAQALNQKQQGHGPSAIIRLNGGSENDAFYISPQAAIDKLDNLITSKFERTATQCQVPVEIFTRAKSGTNQAAGSSYLTHKPLYDLVVSIQTRKRREEFMLVAMMDAMITWRKNGMQPVDLQKHIDHLEMDLFYDLESNPSINQSDAQTYESLVSSDFIPHRKAYWKFMGDEGTVEEQKKLEARRKEAREIKMKPPGSNGFGPEAMGANPKPDKVKESAGGDKPSAGK